MTENVQQSNTIVDMVISFPSGFHGHNTLRLISALFQTEKKYTYDDIGNGQM